MTTQRDELDKELRTARARLRLLEASNESLEDELTETLEQLEDVDIERTQLVDRVGHLSDSEAALSTELSDRREQLELTQKELASATLEVDRLTSTYTSLMSDLEAEVASGQIQIEQLREGIRLKVSDEILFSSGSAKLDPVGREVLTKVITQLRSIDHMIEVQGHTDNRRIRGTLAQRYPSNWDLAAARSARVVRLMVEQGIEGERLSVVSLAEFQPVASNESAEGRALNRRIEIRLQPRDRPVATAVVPSAPPDADPSASPDESATGKQELAPPDDEPSAPTEEPAPLATR
jgi:chemotaxis protein MotB